MKLAVAGLNFRAFDLLNVDRIAIEKCVCCAPLFSARGEREKCLESWKMKKMKAVFGSCKIFSGKYVFSGNAIFRKGKYFQVFGCIMKIFLENIFMCLGVF